MADRSVNVTINYKVNTVEVERGEAKVRQAQAATNQLQQATQQFTSRASQGYQFASRSIESMEVELARLRQQIKLTSTADTQRLTQLSAQYKAAKAQLDAYNKSLFESTKHSKSAQSATRGLVGQVNDLYTAARLFVTAGIVKELVSLGLEAAKVSGNVEGVSRAFNRIPNATLLLQSLRDATHGTVSDLELMQRALMAQSFRIPLENLGTLLEFAAVKAQQTGQEVNHLVNYIISGIGYRSIKRLDDLGFTANRVKEALGGVSLQAASMGDVMSAVTKLMNEDLEKTGGFVETTKTTVEQLEVAWHELGVEVSKQATSGGFIAILKEAVEATKFFFQGGMSFRGMGIAIMLDEVKKEATAVVAKLQEQNQVLKEGERIVATDNRLAQLAENLNIVRDLIQSDKERLAQIEKELPLLEERNKSVIGLQKISGETYKQIKALKEEKQELQSNIEERQRNAAVLSESISIMAEYRMSLTNTARNEETLVGIIEKKRAELEAVREEIEKTRNLSDLGADGGLIKQAEQLEKELNALLGKSDKDQEKREKDAEKRRRENAKRSFEHWKYYDDLRRKKEREAELESFRLAEEIAMKRRRLEEERLEMIEQRNQLILSLSEDFVKANLELLIAGDRNETDRIRQKYDEQIALAEGNDRAQKELRLKRDRELEAAEAKQKEADKKAAVTRLIIDGLVAIGKIFAQFGWPAGIAPAAIMGGITAVNVATVKKLKKGEIDIKGGKQGEDSIPALLMPGESVMTREETKDSRNILKAIRAKKLNDHVLKDIVSGRSGGSVVKNIFDDSKIVRELQAIKNSQPDIVERHGMLMKVHKKGENYRRYVRARVMGNY